MKFKLANASFFMRLYSIEYTKRRKQKTIRYAGWMAKSYTKNHLSMITIVGNEWRFFRTLCEKILLALDRLDSRNSDQKKKDKEQMLLVFTIHPFLFLPIFNVITLSIFVTTISTADTNTKPPEVSIIADQSSIFAR